MHLLLARNAGAAVQLRDDYALGTVYYKRAVWCHDRHVAEKHVLFADVLTRLQAEPRLERTDVALAVHKRLQVALLLGVEAVADEV